MAEETSGSRRGKASEEACDPLREEALLEKFL